MAPPTPWLNPPDIAGAYSHGLQIGAQIGEEQNRLNAEKERAQMELQARQKTAEQEHAMQQARMATEQAYRQNEIGLRQQQLQQAQQVNTFRVQQAATLLAKHAQADKFIAQGMPHAEALWRAGLGTPAMADAENTAKAAAERFGETQRHNRALESEAQTREQRLADKPAATSVPRISNVPLQPGNSEGPKVSMRMDSPMVNQLLGTNAPPGTGTNYGVVPASPAPPASPFKSPDDVKAAAKAGKLTRAQAHQVLRDQFGFEQ